MKTRALGVLALIALLVAASTGWAQPLPKCPASVITECQNSSLSACAPQCKGNTTSNCNACTNPTFEQCVKSKGYSWCPTR